MEWGDKITLSATDARWWGPPYKEGDEVTIGTMLRFPTVTRRLESEFNDFKAEQEARDTAQAARDVAMSETLAEILARLPAPPTTP
jgi:hypothetical protein